MLEIAARACHGAAECSKWPLEPVLEPQGGQVLEACLAVMGLRNLRSKWPLEECRPVLVFYPQPFLLGST